MKFSSEAFKYKGTFSTAILELPADHITYCCSYFEGLDNYALVRTREAGKGELFVYFDSERTDFVKQVVMDLSRVFPVRIRHLEDTMKIDEEIWTK